MPRNSRSLAQPPHLSVTRLGSLSRRQALFASSSLLIIAGLLISPKSVAQVIIRDTLIVSTEFRMPPTQGFGNSLTEVVYVASDSGILAGQIELARKYVPIGSASLSIMLNDTTVLLEATDYVDRYLSWQSVQFRCNDPGTPIYYMEYHALSAAGHALRFFLPEVHVGDTLRFLYRGSIPATEAVGNTVRMKLGDSCYIYYEGELQEKEVCEVQLSVLNSAFAGYIVQSEQDTIAVGDASRLTVAAVDSAGVEVPMDSTVLLRFTITPDSLGKFIKATGDTVLSPLPNVLYADARAGKIQFAATNPLIEFPQTAQVEVVQNSDTSKRGLGTVSIRRRYYLFSQCDPRWKDSTYDHIAKNICQRGCAMTSMAMILKAWGVDANPLNLNHWMKDHKGYGKDGGVWWEALDSFKPNGQTQDRIAYYKMEGKSWKADGQPIELSRIDPYLSSLYSVIVEVKNGTNSHFPIVDGKNGSGDYTTVDPGNPVTSTLADYGNEIFRIIVYKKK